MTLSDYLLSRQLSDAAFARQIGVTRQAVYRYRRRVQPPAWSVLEAIHKATEGVVTPNDFLSVEETAA